MTPNEVEVEARETALSEDHLNLRKLPPVAPLPRPRRFSQTLMRHFDTCKRAGYLYVRHHGGMPAHALDRGTAYHMAKAKVLDLLIEQHQGTAPAGELDEAQRQVRDETLAQDPAAETTVVDEHSAKLMLEEVIHEHPEFTIPIHERDELRVMMVHLANGLPLDPATIMGVERKFVLNLGEHTISGILDLACIEGLKGIVRDSKTEWNPPAQDEYEATFQGRLYAVLLVFGNPVSVYTCDTCDGARQLQPLPPTKAGGTLPCPACEGRGYIETLDPPLGERLQEVDVGEIFPRFISCSACGAKESTGPKCDKCGGRMTMPVRHHVFTRMAIDALRRDLEDQCVALAHAFDTGEFPATSGSHCARCPCEPECPLPRDLRRYAGAITTDEEAKEAAEWHFFWEARLGSTRSELRAYCKANGVTIRFGKDLEWQFVESMKSVPADWDAIQDASRRALETGEVVDVSKLRQRKLGTDFKRVKLKDEQLAKEAQA